MPRALLATLAVIVLLGTVGSSVVASPAGSASGAAHPSLAVASPTKWLPSAGIPRTSSAPSPFGSSPLHPALAPVPAAAPQVVSPILGAGWTGLFFGVDNNISNGWVPPDTQAAAGPNHVVEMVNLLMGIYTKQGGRVGVTALAAFFNSGSDFISDPKIQYDPASGRWFATVTDVTLGQVLLAVSISSDPTAPWNLFKVPSSSSGECPDQPILGVGSTTVIVSVNAFTQTRANPCTTPYLGAQYWVMNKADLIGGVAPHIFASAIDVNEGSIHPVQTQGTSSVHYMVSTYWPGTATTSNTLHLFTVSGTPPGAVTVTVTSLSMPVGAIPPPAPQLGSRNTLDTADIRISDAVWQDGTLWLGFDEACLSDSKRACARLVEIDTTAGTVLQDFDLDVAGKSVFYPAFRMDAQKDLAVVVGYSSSTDYPGILVTGRLYGDPANTLQTPWVAKAGTGPESPGGCSGTCRYGDYFGAGLDPSDTSVVWLAGQFGTSSGWTTYVFSASVKAMITVAGLVRGGGTGYQPPTLSYTLDGTARTASMSSVASVLADPGSTWSVPQALTGSSSAERWQAGTPQGAAGTSGIASASFNATFVYDHQYLVTFGAAVQGSPASAPTIAATSFGLQGWIAANVPAWIDAGSPYAYENPLPGSSTTERWYADGSLTGNVTGPESFSVTYYDQFLVTFEYEVLGAWVYSGPPPTVNVTSFGTITAPAANVTKWADAGSAYAFEIALPASTDTARWGAGTGAVGTITAAGTIHVDYNPQYRVLLQATPSGASGLLTGGGWYGPGTPITVAASSNASWHFQGWTGTYAGRGSSFQITVNSPILATASFWPGLTIAAGNGGSVAYAYGSTTGTVPAGTSLTIYVPPGTSVTLTASAGSALSTFTEWSGAATGTSSSVTITVDGPGTATAAFGTNLAILVGLPALVIAVVALLVLLVMLRRRRRGRVGGP